MTRAALLALFLSSTAIIGYIFYRGLLTAPLPASMPETSAITVPSEPVESLPEFALSNLEGERTAIGSWPGRALLINFWATWCPPCLREIPLLKEFQDEHAGNPVQVVGIAIDRLDPVQEFAMGMEFNYPILIGQADAMDAAAAFGVEFFGLPFSVFTDTQGAVLGVHTGELHPEDLENLAGVLEDLRSGSTGLPQARARIAGRM